MSIAISLSAVLSVYNFVYLIDDQYVLDVKSFDIDAFMIDITNPRYTPKLVEFLIRKGGRISWCIDPAQFFLDHPEYPLSILAENLYPSTYFCIHFDKIIQMERLDILRFMIEKQHYLPNEHRLIPMLQKIGYSLEEYRDREIREIEKKLQDVKEFWSKTL